MRGVNSQEILDTQSSRDADGDTQLILGWEDTQVRSSQPASKIAAASFSVNRKPRDSALSGPRILLRPIVPEASITPRKDRTCANLCCLAGAQFLLAPCISSMPWLIEDLLRPHGVIDYVSDPKAWQGFPGSRDAENADVSAPPLGRLLYPPKRVALVESGGRKQQEHFCAKLNLRI